MLIPAFNAAATLELALKSVQQQSLSDFECVTVDDGSTDETLALAKGFTTKDRRFVTVAVKHGGIVAALNCGIDHCRGRYIARFDADDKMRRERLAMQFEHLENTPELSGLGCHVRLFPRVGLTTGRVAYETWINSLSAESDVSRDRFVECPLAHPTFFMRREVFERFRYRDMPWPEDYDLLLRLLGAGLRLATVPRKLLLWRDSDARLSRTDARYGQSRFVDCKAYFLVKDWLKDELHYILWGYGDTGRLLCRALARYGRLPECIVERHPRRIGQRIFGAHVIAPEALNQLSLPRRKIIVSVACAGPRADVRRTARELGLVEGVDYLCAA